MFSIMRGHWCVAVALLFATTAISPPARGQEGVNEILNELLKDSNSRLIESKGYFLSGDNFKIHYAKAINYVNDMKSIDYSAGSTKAILATEAVFNEGREEWHLVVHGERLDNKKIFIQPARAVFVNHGKLFHYVFTSHDIAPIIYDRVNEKVANRQKDIIKKYDDVEVSFSRYGNKMVLDATYDFNEDEQDIAGQSDFRAALNWESTLSRRMRFVMEESVELMSAILRESKSASKDARNKLKDKSLSYLDRATFMFLIDDGYEDWEVMEGPKEGRWEFTGGETDADYEIYNFGDRLVFSIVEELPGSTSEDQRAEIVRNVDAQVAKKPAKGAHSMEVLLHPEDTDYIWIKANLALDGNVKGKLVAESYSDFKDKYAKEFRKKIQGLFKDYDKAAEKVVDNARDKTYSSVSQEEYELLVEGELDGLLDPAEGVPGGHWAFVIGDDDEERDFEVFNYGERFVYTLSMAMPGESEEQWAEITDKVQALVEGMPAKNASEMEVTRYPEFDHYLWIKASYNIGNGIKGKDVSRQYKDFTEDYSMKLHGKISEIMEDYE
jgi:hypothetical protein